MLPLGPRLEGWAARSQAAFDRETQTVVRIRLGDPDLLARQASLLSRLSPQPSGTVWESTSETGWPRLLSHSEEGRLVTSYHPGLSLAEMVRRFGAPAPARAIGLIRQCAERLQELHQAGSPAGQPDLRSWICSAGRVMLPDPGFPNPPPAPAPEVLLGEEAGSAADVYALGTVAHGLLSGSVFDPPGRERFDALPPQPPVYASLGDSLPALLANCLAPEPAARPQLSELIEALASAARSLPCLAFRTPLGRLFFLEEGQTATVGRNTGELGRVDLDVSDEPLGLTVSRRHARLCRRGLQLEVWSFAGTLDRIAINGSRLIAEPGRLGAGDRLRLGGVELHLEERPCRS